MVYYKSSSGGVDKVYAADNTTGKLTIILDYKGLGMYNVLNQRLSIDTPLSGKSDYEIYISTLDTTIKSDFTKYVDLTKTFLNTL
jgi:hypothetical protein